MCELFGLSRQAYYQQQKNNYKRELKTELILRFVKTQRKIMPNIGVRKLHYLLHEQMPKDMHIGRDSLFDLLRNEGLLVKKRRHKAVTTNSNHWLRKYPNLIKDIIPERPHQILVSDITYVHSDRGFLYLYLITDAYSRKIVGWDLADNLEAVNAVKALKQAIKQIPKEVKEIYHHSDRGVQYCSNKYVKVLKKRKIKISMTESGDPLDNAIAERVNGILKTEWIYGEKLLQYHTAKRKIKKFVSIYNTKRPHLSLGFLTPQKAHQQKGMLERKWKNYYTITEERLPEVEIV